ncbi:hypothetical protein CK203_094507 [Vitis vinifera]|uniref:Uncharacterized protein n=1 Tax=Vitis vinifera TaxID=29760 RepID=A0A438D4H0_VITVI|nr:hypothetical protein CK203_094507 [Vitis vinifera]
MMSEPTYTTRPSSHPSFTEPSHTKIPSHQAPHTPDHAPWMDLSAQISSLDTRMEELAVVNDIRFYSMKNHMDQIERIESLQESQHEEMMAYLRSVFPPPPPQP